MCAICYQLFYHYLLLIHLLLQGYLILFYITEVKINIVLLQALTKFVDHSSINDYQKILIISIVSKYSNKLHSNSTQTLYSFLIWAKEDAHLKIYMIKYSARKCVLSMCQIFVLSMLKSKQMHKQYVIIEHAKNQKK